MAFELWKIKCLLIQSGYRKHISFEGNLVRIAPSSILFPILGPDHGIFFSKVNDTGPLGSGGYPGTSFSNEEFRQIKVTPLQCE